MVKPLSLACVELCKRTVSYPELCCLSHILSTPSKAAATAAGVSVNEAQDCVTSALGAEEDDGDGSPTRPPPKSIVSSDERYELESAAKRARKAGNCVSQVRPNFEGEGEGGEIALPLANPQTN